MTPVQVDRAEQRISEEWDAVYADSDRYDSWHTFHRTSQRSGSASSQSDPGVDAHARGKKGRANGGGSTGAEQAFTGVGLQ